MKKLMAMILTLAMVMSLCVVPASAADGKVTITITPDTPSVDTATGDAVVTYTVKAKVTDSTLKVGALTITLDPGTGLTLAEKTKKADSAFYYEANSSLFYHETFSPSGIFDAKFDYAPKTKTLAKRLASMCSGMRTADVCKSKPVRLTPARLLPLKLFRLLLRLLMWMLQSRIL